MGAPVGSQSARIILLIFGIIILLVAVFLLIAGGTLLGVTSEFTDSEGFISTTAIQFETDSHAIVFQPIDIELGEAVGISVWRPSPGDFVTVKLTGSNNDPSKNVFVGIARESDVNTYFSGVEYDEVTNFRYVPFDVTYTTHPGDAVPADPVSQTFWVVSAFGSGSQSLEWEPEEGSYSVVLMNDDGSAGVDLSARVGARIPLLLAIGQMLFIAGVVALIIGAVMIYFRVRM